MDIGGANVKLADGHGYAESQPFALWQRPDDLGRILRTLIDEAPTCDHIAVTMTGELADCFQNKTEGVQRILDAVEQAAEGRSTRVYLTSGVLESMSAARQRVEEVAAANWHAVARFSGRFAPSGPAILIDVGSTTCDLIPLSDGVPCAVGANDTERLLEGELIYSGVMRTPICGIVSHILWQGLPCSVAREWFATTRDVYILTRDLPEDSADTNTADGKSATIGAAQTRLARMVCADEMSLAEAVVSAEAVAATQADQIAEGICRIVARMGQTPNTIIVSGDGEFLAKRALAAAQLNANVVSLKDQLGERISRCAPAHAVAVLAKEEAIA
jgi:probable H4MPT-linked C1 transfer pathway protein